MSSPYFAEAERSLADLKTHDFKTDYRRLAAEVGDSLAKYKPAQARKPWKKVFPSQTPAAVRARYLKFRREHKPYSSRYGTVGIKILFPAIAKELGITEANARVRYYRGQINPGLIAALNRRLNIRPKKFGI